MNRIKKLRKRDKLSMRDLGKELGVSFATISRYERGEIKISLESAYKLAEYFNVSVDYLLGKSNVNVPSSVDNIFTKYGINLDEELTSQQLGVLQKLSTFKIEEFAKRLKVLNDETLELEALAKQLKEKALHIRKLANELNRDYKFD